MAFWPTDFSWEFHRKGKMAAKKRSPVWCLAPSRMLSITVMRLRALVSWKVRTMPIRASLYGAVPATWRSLNVQVPSSASSNPVIRLKNVVLPAPLGPMRAVIAPR